MTSLEKKIINQIKQGDFMDFPGFKIQAAFRGKKILDLCYGKTYPLYDIASLTKVVFTTTWFVDAVDTKKIKLTDSVSKILPWYRFNSVQVGHLLNHSAGNKWWQPFYKFISSDLELVQRYQQLELLCRQAPLNRGGRAVYSDIDFYLLGSIMQQIANQPLIEIWRQHKAKYYSKSQFHFNVLNNPTMKRSQYAPTEKCRYRKKTLRGEVHDENAWALGGVAPHAGLFGSIDDLFLFGQQIRHSYQGHSNSSFPHRSLKAFARRSVKKNKGDWGYGFMLPSGPQSTAGRHFSAQSFGHTGFTGTSFWFDPKKDLFVCLFSNRVHPSREQKGFVQLRPQLHNWIVEAL